MNRILLDINYQNSNVIRLIQKENSRFYKSHKRVPGYGEIMNLVGFKSKNAVYSSLTNLLKMGF